MNFSKKLNTVLRLHHRRAFKLPQFLLISYNNTTSNNNNGFSGKGTEAAEMCELMKNSCCIRRPLKLNKIS